MGKTCVEAPPRWRTHQLTGPPERRPREPLLRQRVGRISRPIRHVLRAAGELPPHGLATARQFLHQRLQIRLRHGSAVGGHGGRGDVVQDDPPERVLLRRDATRGLVHGHGFHQLGDRAAIRVQRDAGPGQQQRPGHFDREREPGAELRDPDGRASGGSDGAAAEFGRHGGDDGDERSLRFLRLPGWYVQHELPGRRSERRWWQRQL